MATTKKPTKAGPTTNKASARQPASEFTAILVGAFTALCIVFAILAFTQF
jgi:preprotein translocase subunit SecG